MGTLRDIMGDEKRREALIEDALKAIDAEVGDKGGLGGMAIKAAYGMVKGIAPGIMVKLLGNLLPGFLDALQPFYDRAKESGADLKAAFEGRRPEIANALLSVTDGRAAGASSGPLKKGYEKLRPSAQKHVEQAVPRLAELLGRHAG